MTIGEILREGIEYLEKNNISEKNVKARILLAFALNKSKEYLVTNNDKEIEENSKKLYMSYIKELAEGKPLQHITKKQEFMKMDFLVNEDVLIPRPDTEILVEEVISIAGGIKKPVILDLCTGSGAIAVAIAKNIEDSDITASDISNKAIEIAKLNASNNETNEQIRFVESDLFNNIGESSKFDIIVCNPPYIKRNELANLDKEVQAESQIALDGGADGLAFYKKIVEKATKYLNKNGYLCFEIGYDQKNEVIEIIKKNGKYENLYSKKDLGDNDRIIICQLNH